jgi:hypothetical protein
MAPETVERIFGTARELGYDIQNLRRNPERRKYFRRRIEIEADLRFHLRDGTLYDTGIGRLVDISLSGALLGEIQTLKQNIPIAPFTCAIAPKAEALKGVVLEGTVIRYETNGVVELGLRWNRIQRGDRKTLKAFLNAQPTAF